MRRLSILAILAAALLVLAGCGDDDGTKATGDAGVGDTGRADQGKTEEDPGKTEEDPGKAEEDPGKTEEDTPATGDPGEGADPGSGAQIPDEEMQAAGQEAGAMVMTGLAVTRALLETTGDPEFVETVPLANALTADQCALLEGRSLGKCPSYELACVETEAGGHRVGGVTMTWDGGGCGPCKRGGKQVSGKVTVQRNEDGTFTFTYEDHRRGVVSYDGSVTVTASRSADGVEIGIDTGETPFVVAARPTEGEPVVTEITLSPLSIVTSRSAADRVVVEIDGIFQRQGGSRVFAVSTKNAASEMDPLRFAGPAEACVGPTAGSFQVSAKVKDVDFAVVATFGAEAGNEAVCSKPDVEASLSVPEAAKEEILKATAAALKELIETRAGNVPTGEGMAWKALADTAGTATMRLLRVIPQIIQQGDLEKALTEGWQAAVCDEAPSLACESGTGSTTVECAAGLVSGIRAELDQCVIAGTTYDGSFLLKRNPPEEGLHKGTADFNLFAVDDTTITGEVVYLIGNPEPLDVEIRAKDGLIVSKTGSPECSQTISFEVFRLSRTETTHEVEFSGSKTTLEGTYGLVTVKNGDDLHLVWDRPATCTCPTGGSIAEVTTPDLTGFIGQAITLRLTYEDGSEGGDCATVSAALTQPDDLPAVLAEKAVAYLQPLIQAACQPLGGQ